MRPHSMWCSAVHVTVYARVKSQKCTAGVGHADPKLKHVDVVSHDHEAVLSQPGMDIWNSQANFAPALECQDSKAAVVGRADSPCPKHVLPPQEAAPPGRRGLQRTVSRDFHPQIGGTCWLCSMLSVARATVPSCNISPGGAPRPAGGDIGTWDGLYEQVRRVLGLDVLAPLQDDDNSHLPAEHLEMLALAGWGAGPGNAS